VFHSLFLWFCMMVAFANFPIVHIAQRGAWMLHGHSHGNLSDVGGRIMDVGVDSNYFRPVSLEEVESYMHDREISECDHHTKPQKQ